MTHTRESLTALIEETIQAHCFITVDGNYFGFPEVTHIRQFIPVELPT